MHMVQVRLETCGQTGHAEAAGQPLAAARTAREGMNGHTTVHIAVSPLVHSQQVHFVAAGSQAHATAVKHTPVIGEVA